MEMWQFILIPLIVSILGSCASVFASTGFWDWLKSRKGKLSPAERLTMAMGRDRLIFVSKRYLKQGYIPEDEYDMFIDMGEAYLAMGGNHYGEKLFNKAKELDTREE